VAHNTHGYFSFPAHSKKLTGSKKQSIESTVS